MEMICKVPLPVVLNCWKHHAGFIKSKIKLLRKEQISKNELRRLLLIIGESQMDLYLGNSNPMQIANEIINNIMSLGANNYTKYCKWLSKDGMSYKQMGISDSSVWTLRLGNDKKRYLHIHPGRYSPVTTRVKSITLKTTIAVKVLSEVNNDNFPDLDTINEARTALLKLPPLKSVSLSSGLGKFINTFNRKN